MMRAALGRLPVRDRSVERGERRARVDPPGTPFGIQVVGRDGGDWFTLGVTHALERLFEADAVLHRPVPSAVGA